MDAFFSGDRILSTILLCLGIVAFGMTAFRYVTKTMTSPRWMEIFGGISVGVSLMIVGVILSIRTWDWVVVILWSLLLVNSAAQFMLFKRYSSE